MQELIELVYIVTKNKLRGLDQIALPMDGGSKLWQLYDGISQGRFQTQEEAIARLYPEADNTDTFRKLKSKLWNRLINSLFFIDIKQPSFNNYQKAYYECHKNWAATKILLGRNAHEAALELCMRTYAHAEKYEFTSLLLDITRTLRMHYAARHGDGKRFAEFNAKYHDYLRIYEAEGLAEELYADLIIHFVNEKSAKNEEIHQRALEHYRQLEPWLTPFSSYTLHLYANLIHLMAYTSVNDLAGAIQVCEQAIRFFEAKPFEAHVPLQIFYYQELVFFTQLRQFDRGDRAATRCLELIEEGSFNWFKYQELYFLLSMQTGQYRRAYDVFLLVMDHKRFRFLPEGIVEIWKIYQAYLYYLIEIGKLTPEEENKHFSKFLMGRFLNDTPIYSKDKRGMNVAILVIQILFLILRRKYSEAIDRIEAVDKYCSRYLQDDETARSNAFIRMLLQVPLSSFHKTAVIRKAAPYLTRLQSLPNEVANQSMEIEIIPFEELWDFVLESLEEKFFRPRSPRRPNS